MPDTILIIDDEAAIRETLSGILGDEGFTPLAAGSAEEGLQLLDEKDVDLVLLDIWLPGMDGLEGLGIIRQRFAHLPVIMISGHGTVETAVQATRMGAFDFIEKPLSYDKTVLAIRKGLEVSRLERENRLLRASGPDRVRLIGDSPLMQQLREQIDRVAPTDAWVLIRGGHGTGKELVAQTIHAQSQRSRHPMVAVNCAAIPEELIESELFGHVKGAFTGATETRKGKFDLANGSTLFLDEIGDMSLKSQAKVLRILQEQKFERVGGARTIEVDVRVLAATNKNLEEEIEHGRFRADLFYRLNVVPIVVPDLVERRADVPLLVEEFARQFGRKGLGHKDFAAEAMALLQRHAWPGNVRELRNLVERLMIMTPGDTVTAADVSLFLGGAPLSPPPAPARAQDYGDLSFKEARRRFEADYLHIRLIHSAVARPQGRGKVERFFGTVNTELLTTLPGHLASGAESWPAPALSSADLDAAVGAFVLDYNDRAHSELGVSPRAAWIADGWLPRLPDSLQALDGLLLTVARSRTVRRDGIHFQGMRYVSPTLAGFVGRPVVIRYDPRDVTEIRVFDHDQFLCTAVDQEHHAKQISLKDVQAARNARRRALRRGINERIAVVAAHTPDAPARPAPPRGPTVARLKVYKEDLT